MPKKCVEQGCKDKLIPIYQKGTYCGGDESDYSDKYICLDCVEESEDFGMCRFCNEDAAFHINDLETDGWYYYCKEHYQEIIPEDADDEEDWDSYCEYINDPTHD